MLCCTAIQLLSSNDYSVYRTMPCILSHIQTSSHHHSRCCSRYTGYQYSTIATGLQHRTNHIQKVTRTLMPAYLNELLAPCHLLDRLHDCLLAHCLPFCTSSPISTYDPSVVQYQLYRTLCQPTASQVHHKLPLCQDS